MTSKLIIVLLSVITSPQTFASLSVITTTTNAKALVNEIGGDRVHVESLTKGHQDPHFVDAKPSFIIKVSRADLLVSIGLELEIGWLPSILRGARNKKLMDGEIGSLTLGNFIKPLNIPTGPTSRDQGDVHPDGNPHFLLDPLRTSELGLVVAHKLAELDPDNAKFFHKRAKIFKSSLTQLTESWKNSIRSSGVTEIITHHTTLNYFLNRMNITSIASIEPKPGVPPTASHILSLIKLAKKKKVGLILVENFFELTPALRVKREIPNINVLSVPVSVNGNETVKTLEALYTELAKSMTNTTKEEQ